MDEWVYKLPDRASYLEHYIDRFGKQPLDRPPRPALLLRPHQLRLGLHLDVEGRRQGPHPGCDHGRVPEKILEDRGFMINVD